MRNDVRPSSPSSGELARVRLIRWYQLHDFALIGTGGQKLCLDATDATTDFQHPLVVQRAG